MKISKHSSLASVIGFLVMALAVLFIPPLASAQNTGGVRQQPQTGAVQAGAATRPRVVIIAPPTKAQPERIVQFEKTLNPNAAQLKIRFPRGKSNAEIYGSFDRFNRSIYIAGSARTFSTGRIIHLPPLFRRR